METLVRAAEHPRIVAVKDAKGDLGAVAWTLARTDLAYYSGEDMLNLPLLALGAVGVVSVVGHLVGPRLAELIAAVESGDLVKARAVNESLLPVYTGIFRTQGVILTKAALRELGPARWAGPPAAGRRHARAARAAAHRSRRRRRPAVTSAGDRAPPVRSPSPTSTSRRRRRCPTGGLRVIALGGLGEIGRNMAVLEFDGRLLVIDCGVLFPEAEQPGVDLILPDFGVIEHRLDDVDGRRPHPRARGPHRRDPVPAAAARRHPAGRARGSPSRWSRPSCASTGSTPCWSRSPPATTTSPGRSTASSSSSTTRSPTRWPSPCRPRRASLVHTGDFKMDQLPLDGVLTDLGAFARLGLRGHRPAAGRLHQRRGARLRHLRARRSARCSRTSSPAPPSG